MARIGLAIVIAIAIGYAPAQLLARDARAIELDGELDKLEAQARAIDADNDVLRRDIDALRGDIHAIEARARADLGLVYPDEIVMRVEP